MTKAIARVVLSAALITPRGGSVGQPSLSRVRWRP